MKNICTDKSSFITLKVFVFEIWIPILTLIQLHLFLVLHEKPKLFLLLDRSNKVFKVPTLAWNCYPFKCIDISSVPFKCSNCSWQWNFYFQILFPFSFQAWNNWRLSSWRWRLRTIEWNPDFWTKWKGKRGELSLQTQFLFELVGNETKFLETWFATFPNSV